MWDKEGGVIGLFGGRAVGAIGAVQTGMGRFGRMVWEGVRWGGRFGGGGNRHWNVLLTFYTSVQSLHFHLELS
jgi:hypothetical protein